MTSAWLSLEQALPAFWRYAAIDADKAAFHATG
jgi:hypothetical protein